ncbi:MAG TPA: PqiC family protein [Spongiibacteraceae bacterium]|nr:PqiC family protein [Spongiibacteraceae bacterium]
MKLKKIAALSAALLVSTSALIGCGSAPRERYYALSANIDAQPTAQLSSQPFLQERAANYGVVIGPITIPDVVDRPQMVVLMADSQVSVAEQSRWAEPLDSGIARVVADNLAHSLSGARVSSFAQSHTVVADYRVLIDVQHFDSIVGEGIRDEFLWTVRATNKGGITKSGRTITREAANSDDYAALVAAHNRALATLSRDVATAIQAMP